MKYAIFLINKNWLYEDFLFIQLDCSLSLIFKDLEHLIVKLTIQILYYWKSNLKQSIYLKMGNSNIQTHILIYGWMIAISKYKPPITNKIISYFIFLWITNKLVCMKEISMHAFLFFNSLTILFFIYSHMVWKWIYLIYIVQLLD